MVWFPRSDSSEETGVTARVVGVMLLIALPAFAQAPAGWEEARERAHALRLEQKDTEAIAVLTQYATRQPRFVDAQIELGDAHARLATRLRFEPQGTAQRTQHLEAAERAYRRALDLEKPQPQAALVGLAEVLGPDGLNRPAQAEPVLRQLMARDPDRTFWDRRLAAVVAAAGRTTEAATLLRAATTRGSASDRSMAANAMVDLAKETPGLPPAEARRLADDAIAALARAVTDAPDDADLYAFQANALRARAALETDATARKAIEQRAWTAFGEHLVRSPAYPVTPPRPGAALPTMANPPAGWDRESMRAEALSRAGRHAEAASAMVPWITAYPTFVAAHYTRALYLALAGESDQLGKALAAARTAVPATAEARREAVLFLSGSIEMTDTLAPPHVRTLVTEARTLIDEAVKIAPRDPDVLFSKAGVLRLQATRLERVPAAARKLTLEADRLEERAFQIRTTP